VEKLVNTQPDSVPKRPARFGLWLAGLYVLLAAGLFVVTAVTTTPDKMGWDWIPFFSLSLPWSGMDRRFWILGILLNGVILWALGTAVQKLVRILRRS
jgi:hypothetical protein